MTKGVDRAEPNTPLLARPVQGIIDHEALSREFMCRFPVIRYKLAGLDRWTVVRRVDRALSLLIIVASALLGAEALCWLGNALHLPLG
jgi:hypothetical protein